MPPFIPHSRSNTVKFQYSDKESEKYHSSLSQKRPRVVDDEQVEAIACLTQLVTPEGTKVPKKVKGETVRPADPVSFVCPSCDRVVPLENGNAAVHLRRCAPSTWLERLLAVRAKEEAQLAKATARGGEETERGVEEMTDHVEPVEVNTWANEWKEYFAKVSSVRAALDALPRDASDDRVDELFAQLPKMPASLTGKAAANQRRRYEARGGKEFISL
jgi:hypothetical protein